MKEKRRIHFVPVIPLAITLLVFSPFISDGNSATAQAKAKVKLNKKTVNTMEGTSFSLKTKNNKKKVKWTVSNKKIIAIKKKKKTSATFVAKAVGTAKITAKVSGKKLACKVTVNAKQGTKPGSYSGTTPGKNPQNTQPPSEATQNYDAGEFSLDKIHTGEATFYVRTSSAGAANLDKYESIYYTCAMYEGDYLQNMAGAYLEVTDKDGDKVNVMVTDILPYAEGKSGNLDLLKPAFLSIEPEVTGRMNISWRIIPLPTSEPISYLFKPTSSQYWAEVQVRNHRYPIKSLEYYDKSQRKYIALQRQRYNYFTAPKGMGEGPYQFRVTDIYGHSLVDTGISINNSEKEINGANNFPY